MKISTKIYYWKNGPLVIRTCKQIYYMFKDLSENQQTITFKADLIQPIISCVSVQKLIEAVNMEDSAVKKEFKGTRKSIIKHEDTKVLVAPFMHIRC